MEKGGREMRDSKRVGQEKKTEPGGELGGEEGL